MAPRNTRTSKDRDENLTLAEMKRSKLARSGGKNKVVVEEYYDEPEVSQEEEEGRSHDFDEEEEEQEEEDGNEVDLIWTSLTNHHGSFQHVLSSLTCSPGTQ